MEKNFSKIIQNKKTIVVFIIAVLLLTFFYSAGKAISQLSDLSRLKAQKFAYAQQLEEQKAENEELDAILQSDNMDEYMEQKAREKGYVKSDETVFYDISGIN